MKLVRTALITLVVVLVASAVAFAGGTKESSAASSSSTASSSGTMVGANPTSFTKFAVEPNASIVFSGWGDQTEQKIYKDSIARFEKIYPNVKVDYQPIPSNFQTKIKAMAAAGTQPDVFYVDDQLMAALGLTGQLMPLDSYMAKAGVKRSGFIPELLRIFTYQGKTYALPKDWGTLGLVYLPEAFKAAGIPEPNNNWTWSDLEKAAMTIKQKTKYAGFVQAADWARFAPFVFELGGNYTNSSYTKPTLDTSAVKQAATFIEKMKKEGALVTPSDVGASWSGEAIGKQLAAMTYEGGWMVNFMRQSYPKVNWKAVELSKAPNGKRSDVIFTNGIGVSAHTKYPKAAAALAIYLTSPENQAIIESTGFAYSTHPDQLKLIKNPNDKEISAGGLIGKVAYWGPNSGKIENQVSKALERIFLGQQNVDQAFAQANSEVKSILSGG